MAAYRRVYDSRHPCRLTAKKRDQLRNPTLGNRVWATFFSQSYSRDGNSDATVQRQISIDSCGRRVPAINRYLPPAPAAGSVMLRSEVRGLTQTCWNAHSCDIRREAGRLLEPASVLVLVNQPGAHRQDHVQHSRPRHESFQPHGHCSASRLQLLRRKYYF